MKKPDARDARIENTQSKLRKCGGELARDLRKMRIIDNGNGTVFIAVIGALFILNNHLSNAGVTIHEVGVG